MKTVMIFDVSLISARCGEALFAVLLVLILQGVAMIISRMTRRAVLPMPLMEFVFRSVFIGVIDRLNRSDRSAVALMIRGGIVAVLVMVCFLAVASFLEYALSFVGMGYLFDMLLLTLVVSPISIMMTAWGVSAANTKAGQYKMLAQATNQNFVLSDEHGLRRGAYHALCLSLSEWLVAPVLFYLIGGIGFAYFYVAVSLFVRLSGQKNPAFTSIFGLFYVLGHGVVNGLASFFVWAASFFVAGGRPLRGLRAFGCVFSPHMLIAMFAHGQNVVLGGAAQDRLGQSISAPWIGPEGATAKLDHRDILRALMHYTMSVFLFCVALFALFAFV